MRLSSDLLGVTVGPIQHDVDIDWITAFASGIGESETIPDVVAHPLFPVCYEWPALVAVGDQTVSEAIRPRGVHATHDMTIHRLPRPGDRLSTTATTIGVEPRKPGTYVLTRLRTVDQAGAPVTTTDHGTLYLGVEFDSDLARGSGSGGSGRSGARRVEAEPGTVWWQIQVEVASDLARIYSECSRIWNPIHTDRAAAVQAGLPDVILHGTATLALAVSRILTHEGESPERVRRIACRFGAMVFMPSTLIVRGARSGTHCYFHALTEESRPAVNQGLLAVVSERTS
ncbi:MAG: MaoC/PaaZ C-terminal domain-containing protein [Candidatus Methylomirabilia bacterium]